MMSQQQQWQQWQLEGNIPQAYEKYLVPALFAPWAAKLIDFAKLEPGERVLDVACGTGIVARLAAQREDNAAKIVGIDLNPQMLEIARQSSSDVTMPIQWLEGSATDIQLPEATFDVVFCQASLMYFAEPQATQEMHRMLVPGGRLAVNVWRPIQYSPGYVALAEALERHVSSEVAAMMKLPFSLGDAEKVRKLIVGVGFRDVHIRLDIDMVRFPSSEEFIRRQVVSSPLAGPVSQVDDNARAALLEDFSGAMHAYRDDDGLAFPIEAYLAVAHK
jgi:SAM-dependent methyltransferase